MRLYGILTLMFLTIFFSCNGTDLREGKKEPISVEHKRIFSKGDLTVEKITIEEHEYLLFYGRLATSPSVVHNENCPCKILNSMN